MRRILMITGLVAVAAPDAHGRLVYSATQVCG